MANNTYTFVGSEIRPISGIEDSKILSAGYIYDDNYGEKINQNTIMINNLHDILSDLKYGISSLKNGLDALIIRVENLEGGVEYLITYENGNIKSVSPTNITKRGGDIKIVPDKGYSVSNVDRANDNFKIVSQNLDKVQNAYITNISDVIGDVALIINTSENIPISINVEGTDDDGNIIITGNNEHTITVSLLPDYNGLTQKNGKFEVSIEGDVTITNRGTEFDNGATLTIKRKGIGTFSNNLTGNIKIISKANNTLKKNLNIKINPILVTGVSITNEEFAFNGTDNKNSNTRTVKLSASVSPDDTTQDKGVTFSFVDNTSVSQASIANSTLTVKQPGKYTIKATSTANDKYTSDPKEFTFNDGKVETVSISGLPTSIPVNGNTYDLNAVIEDTIFGELPPITWKMETNIGTLSSTTGSSVKLTIPKNENTSTRSISVSATCNGVKGTTSGTQQAQSVKYYWYVGSMTEADALNPTTLGNIVNGKNATSSTTGISTVTIPNDAANEVIVFVYPEIWGRPTIKSENGFGTGDSYYKDEGFELPTGYNASFWPGDQPIKGKTLKITWSK